MDPRMHRDTDGSAAFRLIRVVGPSMLPTYRPAELLVARPVGRAGVRRGDVVVFRHGGVRMLKRAVGMAGDLVELEAGRLFVNGTSVDGRPRIRGALVRTWRVPEASYFLAGDNPEVSDDSRVWREPFVAADRIKWVVTRAVSARLRRRRPVRSRRPAVAGDRGA